MATVSVRAVRKDIPEALDRIVMRALAKRAKDRFATAGEMQRALEDWLARNGGAIADVRLALTVGGYFNGAEKQPLPKQAAQFTGTFAALTGAKPSRASEPEVDVEQPEWAQSFAHAEGRASSRPPPSVFRPNKSPSLVDRFFELSPVVAFLVTLAVGGTFLALLLGLYYVVRY